MKLVNRVILLVCIVLVLSACGSGSAAPPEPSPTPDSPARFAMIIKGKDNPYMNAMFEGFRIACGETGDEAVLMEPESYTAKAQAVLIEQAVEDGADAIAIAANHVDELEAPLRKAMDAGVCVVSLDSSVNAESRMLHIQQADPETVGRVLIQAANKMAGGSGTAVIISSTPYATNQNIWLEWMKTEYRENPDKYKDFKLLEDCYGDDSLEKTRKETLRLLDEHPELNIIITPSAVSMKAVGTVLKERDSAVLFTGLGLPSETAEFIENGSCPWMYLWNPVDMGYLAAYASNAIVTGEITASHGDNFTAGRLGIRSVSDSPDGGTEVLLGNPMKFDAENISQWKSVY